MWMAILGAGMIAAVLLLSLAAWSGILPYDPWSNDLDRALSPPRVGWLRRILAPETPSQEPEAAAQTASEEWLDWPAEPGPSPATTAAEKPPFPLGSDANGRDYLSRLIQGGTAYWLPGLVAVALSLVLGAAAGAVAGYRPESLAARLVDAMSETIAAFPRLILILLGVAIWRPNIMLIMTLLGFTNIPRVAESIRARVQALAQAEFVEAARSLGTPEITILFRHLVLRHCRTLLLVQASYGMADAVLVETGLCYLGFGVQEPAASWGNLVIDGGKHLFLGRYWLAVLPATALIWTLLGFLLLGDGLARLARTDR
jgi:peptide/nickel transport system permease protein